MDSFPRPVRTFRVTLRTLCRKRYRLRGVRTRPFGWSPFAERDNAATGPISISRDRITIPSDTKTGSKVLPLFPEVRETLEPIRGDWGPVVSGYAVAATGDNTVYLNADATGLQHSASLRDRSYGFFDLAIGCFAYQNGDANLLTAAIPTAEIHHKSALDNTGVVTAGNLQVRDLSGSTSLASAVIGTTFELLQRSQLTIGYTVPHTSADR